MVKNQLFRIIPDEEVINSLLELFGLTSLNDTKCFTMDTLNEYDTISKLNEMKDDLQSYYLPCKAKNYMNNITKKRCIVILRQFIRVYGYTLISKERYVDGKKISVYRIIEDDKGLSPNKKKGKKPITISFQ